jgi:aspartyl protease family protein
MTRGRYLLVILAIAAALGALFAWLIGRYPDALEDQGNLIRIVAMLGWLVLVGGAGLAFIRAQPGTALRNIAVWVAIGLVLVLGYSLKDEIGGALMPSAGTETADGTMQFERGLDGHFHVEAEVDGVRIRFLVDTGASDVVFSAADARRLGFDPEKLDYSQRYSTANGPVLGAPVRLDEIVIGSIRVADISASVNQGEMDGSLLGMSFLSRLSGFSVEGDRLVLKP